MAHSNSHKLPGRRGVLWFILVLVVTGPVACTPWKKGIPEVRTLKDQYPHVKYLGPGKEPDVELKKNKPAGWTPLSAVSVAARGAIVVSEDWAFFQHGGLDFNQIQEAARDSFEKGHTVRGASTITQQVVKNVFLSREKSFTRKIVEAFLSVQLEKVVTKNRILEVYLNIAEWGEGIYGIGPAARFYFQKSPSELTPKEGAFLAMLLPSPKRYSQSFRKKKLTPFANRVIRSILLKMVHAGYLKEEDRQKWISQPLSFEPLTSVPPMDQNELDQNEKNADEEIEEEGST